jgi:Golgi phosphoprotein 3
VDKGVLRTEKKSFVLFDVPTHPVSNPKIKEALIQRIVDGLLGRGPPPTRRTIACICAAYAANVLENAFVGLSHSQREQAFQKADEMLREHAALSDSSRSAGVTDIMAGYLLFNLGSLVYIRKWIAFYNKESLDLEDSC